MADATSCLKSKPSNRGSNISETKIYYQNSNGEPTAFDYGELAGSVPRRFQ